MHSVDKYLKSFYYTYADTAAGAEGIAENKDLVLVEFNVSKYTSKFKNYNSKFLKNSLLLADSLTSKIWFENSVFYFNFSHFLP